ncbi:hypothetical protein [Paucibacter soli]|uniref:hypothetical protein n=1 Tax=Paucibacter soli TaxID=3133433 RepID=UPI0030A8363A
MSEKQGEAIASQSLSDGGYEMLRAAVNTARQHECRSVKGLKRALLAAWPGRDSEIDEAMAYWSANIRQRHPNGVPRH